MCVCVCVKNLRSLQWKYAGSLNCVCCLCAPNDQRRTKRQEQDNESRCTHTKKTSTQDAARILELYTCGVRLESRPEKYPKLLQKDNRRTGFGRCDYLSYRGLPIHAAKSGRAHDYMYMAVASVTGLVVSLSSPPSCLLHSKMMEN